MENATKRSKIQLILFCLNYCKSTDIIMKKSSTAKTIVAALLSMLAMHAALATPKVTLTVSAPEASAGADANLTGIFKGMPWLPCTAKNETFRVSPLNKVKPATTTKPADLLQFDISVTNEDKLTNGTSAGPSDGIMDNDLYVFLVNANASGDAAAFDQALLISTPATIPHAQIWAIISPSFNSNPAALKPYANVNTIAPTTAVFKTADNFIGTSFTATLLGGPMFFDKTAVSSSLPQGPWLIVAILVNAGLSPSMSATQLQNPQNWEAWDIKPFILGSPFYLPNKGTGLIGANGKCK
jgi:hypothetical protein